MLDESLVESPDWCQSTYHDKFNLSSCNSAENHKTARELQKIKFEITISNSRI